MTVDMPVALGWSSAEVVSECWWIARAGEKLGGRSDHVLIDR